MPLIRTYMHSSRKSPLKGLMYNFGKLPLRGLLYHYRKIAFDRAAEVCMKQGLWVGLRCIILGVAFKRAANVCKEQCL